MRHRATILSPQTPTKKSANHSHKASVHLLPTIAQIPTDPHQTPNMVAIEGLEPTEARNNQEGPPQSQQQNATKNNKGAKTTNMASSAKMAGDESEAANQTTRLSNAELKKRAKEEKAAKRAKEKQEKQSADPSNRPSQSQQDTKPTSNSGARRPSLRAPGSKHIKKQESATNNPQQQLPIRTPETQIVTTTAIPKKDDKKVALFSHLYGNSRRTTMSGAGKDIHPAVVTLGLKMSHYIICCSNARCVAMLLAFKRVCCVQFFS